MNQSATNSVPGSLTVVMSPEVAALVALACQLAARCRGGSREAAALRDVAAMIERQCEVKPKDQA